MKLMTLPIVALSSILLAACAPQIPYRATGFTVAPGCQALYDRHAGAEVISEPQSPCWQRASEERQAYDLLFAEFDDQGWTQGTTDAQKRGPDHLDQLLERLARLSSEHGKAGLSLVVFVHGWHHNAAANDENVREFRALLQDLSVIERQAGGRRVVGLYVGWRGDSITLPWLNTLTFWERKNTAEKVAQGSVRELFSRLDTLRDRAADKDHKRIRMLAIGHSFGGLIVFETLSGEFIRGVSRYRDGAPAAGATPSNCDGARHHFARVGDLVVLVNPAFEGARYEALRAAARRVNCIADNQWPLLITATSTADKATGVAFPVARWFNTLFETDPAQEREANVKTVGHNARYVTHTLSICDAGDSRCKNACAAPAPLQSQVQGAPRSQHLRDEMQFLAQRRATLFGKEEYLCDGLKLTSTGQWSPAGNPHWVVETSGDIITGHNDIFNPAFIAFIRQAYVGVRNATGD